jgi:hypothetical protein
MPHPRATMNHAREDAWSYRCGGCRSRHSHGADSGVSAPGSPRQPCSASLKRHGLGTHRDGVGIASPLTLIGERLEEAAGEHGRGVGLLPAG